MRLAGSRYFAELLPGLSWTRSRLNSSQKMTPLLNFRNFQGFVEEIYNCIPDKEKCNWCPSWNWGDDEIFNPEADSRMTHQVDLVTSVHGKLLVTGLKVAATLHLQISSTTYFGHHAWYCIRKANQGLANLDKLVASKAERRPDRGSALLLPCMVARRR